MGVQRQVPWSVGVGYLRPLAERPGREITFALERSPPLLGSAEGPLRQASGGSRSVSAAGSFGPGFLFANFSDVTNGSVFKSGICLRDVSENFQRSSFQNQREYLTK
jgi:hypothetical protein